jgi:hypothetical protein
VRKEDKRQKEKDKKEEGSTSGLCGKMNKKVKRKKDQLCAFGSLWQKE